MRSGIFLYHRFKSCQTNHLAGVSLYLAVTPSTVLPVSIRLYIEAQQVSIRTGKIYRLTEIHPSFHILAGDRKCDNRQEGYRVSCKSFHYFLLIFWCTKGWDRNYS